MLTKILYKLTKFNSSQIKYKKRVFKVDIADTSPKRALGLMHRKDMRRSEGMLFILGKEAKYEITMVNMNFPIDIIWMDRDGKIVDIFRNARPSKSFFLWEMYAPKRPAKYVLEVMSGVAGKSHLAIGGKLDLKNV